MFAIIPAASGCIGGGVSLEHASLDEHSAESAQQPRVPAESTEPQAPTTVTAKVVDPKPYGNLPIGPNNYFSGMGSLIEFTVKDQKGNPMSNITVTEAVTPATTVQNSSPVTRQDGKVIDLVGRGSFGPQLTEQDARAAARDARNTPNKAGSCDGHTVFERQGSCG